MLDLIRRKQTDFSQIDTVVLDEADEMLNMGFREELDAILAETPDTKRTCLFSATMPKEIREISSRYMKDPEEITIGSKTGHPTALYMNIFLSPAATGIRSSNESLIFIRVYTVLYSAEPADQLRKLPTILFRTATMLTRCMGIYPRHNGIM